MYDFTFIMKTSKFYLLYCNNDNDVLLNPHDILFKALFNFRTLICLYILIAALIDKNFNEKIYTNTYKHHSLYM